jgi:hypothetical protein
MTYMGAALNLLFGCHHGNLSRVFTIGGRTYRVCCDCGAQFRYSLDTMSIQQQDSSQRQPCHFLHFNGAR